jgi:uncharacterized membrane-anchored protein
MSQKISILTMASMLLSMNMVTINLSWDRPRFYSILLVNRKRNSSIKAISSCLIALNH